MESPNIITREQDGLAEMRCLIKDYLNSGEGSEKVRDYLWSIVEEDPLLLIYLKGRKYRAQHAWETLKRKAEVCFDEYPEVFPDEIPDTFREMERKGILGILKCRDEQGRKIFCFNAEEWDPNEISLEQLTSMCTPAFDRLLLDEDVINNGLVLIQNCSGMGLRHAKHYTLHSMLRLMNIFYLSYPIKFKGFYYVNIPFYLRYLYKLIQPFLSKKLKERLILTSNDKKFEVLHKSVSPSLLPKFLGGVHENNEAFDLEFFQYKK